MGRFVRVMTNCFAGRLLNSTRHLTSSPNPSVPSWAACQTSCHPGRCKSHSSSAKQGQPHRPVLLDEVLEAFEPIQLRRFVDGTLGAGGHSRAVASAHGELERLYGFDRDFTAHDLAAKNLATIMDVHPLVDPTVGEPSLPPSASGPLVVPVLSNFAALLPALQALDPAEEPNVDGILLDLGVSSMQLDTDERGFSFMRDGPLNMRMDGSDSGTAELGVNEWSEAKLGQTIRDYGEERHWKSIARRIVERRMERRITTTQELVRAIGGKNIPGKKHPATKTFQALRIAVNGELEAVEAVIPDAIELLRPGGRLAIITFHSLEDRLVKWAFRKAAGMRTREEEDDPMTAMLNMSEVAREKKVKLVTRKPIKPSAEEMAANPRARSSKLRVIERL